MSNVEATGCGTPSRGRLRGSAACIASAYLLIGKQAPSSRQPPRSFPARYRPGVRSPPPPPFPIFTPARSTVAMGTVAMGTPSAGSTRFRNRPAAPARISYYKVPGGSIHPAPFIYENRLVVPTHASHPCQQIGALADAFYGAFYSEPPPLMAYLRQLPGRSEMPANHSLHQPATKLF